jgi:heme A synthase
VIQVVLVGLEIFAEVGGSMHRDFAYIYGWLTPILVLLAGLARVPTRVRSLTVVLLGLFALQTILPSLSKQLPLLGAFHTVIALAMFWLAVIVARRATDLVRPSRTITEG